MSKGKLKLGDKVEAIIKAVVPKKIIKKVKSRGCNCGQRKRRLNKY